MSGPASRWVAVEPERALSCGELVLEPLTAEHAAALFSPQQERSLYTFIPQVPPRSVEALRARYQRWESRGSKDGSEVWLNYAIRWNGDPRYVGTLQATVSRDAESYLAYQVFRDFRRRGFAAAACRGLIAHLFTCYPIDAIHARVDTRNEASWGLLEALGFLRVARIDDADFFKGELSHEYEYALGRERWLAPDPAPNG